MKIDCQWLESNLAAFFCDCLTVDENRLARLHIESCSKCHEEVRSLYAIDPLVKRVFLHNLSLAVAPKRRRFGVLYGAAAAAALASIILVVVLRPTPDRDLTTPQASGPVISAPLSAEVPAIAKNPVPPPAERAKPQPATVQPTVPATSRPTAAASGPAPDFLVTDPAGYSRTLEDFRGKVFLVGVWSSDQPQAVANLERLYRAFGANTKLRILGVSNERGAKPPNTTFPVAYNQGSRLLGAAPSEFVLVDETGAVRLRGSLLEESSQFLRTLRTALNPLGIH